MEHARGYEKKLISLEQALDSFGKAMAMKQLYRIQYVNEKNYETLIEIIND